VRSSTRASRSSTTCFQSPTSITPTDLVDFVEAPVAFSPTGPETVLIDDDRFVARAEIGNPWAHVQRIRLTGHDVDAAVEAARSVMARTGASIASWWLCERSTPDDVEDDLLARGLRIVDGDYLVDGLLLTSEPPPGPAGIDARATEGPEELAAAHELQNDVFGVPPDRRRHPEPDKWERVYAAWIDGRVAGAGRAYFTPRGVMMAGGATAPWARGRGAYRALVRARWDDAAARGTPAIAVHAKETSSPILVRLGFEKVLQFRRLEDVASSG
jgi:hypothetical protein